MDFTNHGLHFDSSHWVLRTFHCSAKKIYLSFDKEIKKYWKQRQTENIDREKIRKRERE